jgi:hypothetical protein
LFAAWFASDEIVRAAGRTSKEASKKGALFSAVHVPATQNPRICGMVIIVAWKHGTICASAAPSLFS